MPNIKSAKKRVEISERNRVRNHAYKSAVRTAIRRVLESIQQKSEVAEIATRVAKANSLMDRAVLKGILHKNTVARTKSRLTKAVAKATAA